MVWHSRAGNISFCALHLMSRQQGHRGFQQISTKYMMPLFLKKLSWPSDIIVKLWCNQRHKNWGVPGCKKWLNDGTLCDRNRKRHYFPRLLSTGNNGTTGTTVENLHERRQKWLIEEEKKAKREIQNQIHWVNGRAFTQWRALILLLRWWFKTRMLDQRLPNLCVINLCLIPPFHITEIRVWIRTVVFLALDSSQAVSGSHDAINS